MRHNDKPKQNIIIKQIPYVMRKNDVIATSLKLRYCSKKTSDTIVTY